MSLEYEQIEPTVLGQISTTNFELLRLVKNGGTLDSRGNKKVGESLFTVRVIKGSWATKLPSGQTMYEVILQVVSSGINNATARKDVIVHKIVEKQTIIKEIEKKPNKTQQTFKTDENVKEKNLFNIEDLE